MHLKGAAHRQQAIDVHNRRARQQLGAGQGQAVAQGGAQQIADQQQPAAAGGEAGQQGFGVGRIEVMQKQRTHNDVKTIGQGIGQNVGNKKGGLQSPLLGPGLGQNDRLGADVTTLHGQIQALALGQGRQVQGVVAAAAGHVQQPQGGGAGGQAAGKGANRREQAGRTKADRIDAPQAHKSLGVQFRIETGLVHQFRQPLTLGQGRPRGDGHRPSLRRSLPKIPAGNVGVPQANGVPRDPAGKDAHHHGSV